MRVIAGDPARPRQREAFEQTVADYVAEQFPAWRYMGRLKPYRAVGFVDDDGRLCGGLVMTDYRGFDADLSIYLAKPGNFIGLHALRELFSWAFDGLKVRRLTCRISPLNRRSIKFVEKVGFHYEGTMRLGLDGVNDAAIYGMTRDDCIWIKDEKAS